MFDYYKILCGSVSAIRILSSSTGTFHSYDFVLGHYYTWLYDNMGLTIFCVDTADSVSREMVEAGLVNGKDMIVG